MDSELQEQLRKVIRDAQVILDDVHGNYDIDMFMTHAIHTMQLLGITQEHANSCWASLRRIVEKKQER